MTTAILTQQTELMQTRPILAYQVAMSKPTSHLFEVTLQISGWDGDVLDLKMAVWTPGSYLIREYSRHVQDLVVKSGQQALVYRKLTKNHWQIATLNESEITISYRVFAHELTVRTNHLDATHGYFNGAALFLFVPELVKQPSTITIIPPQAEWKITTALPLVVGQENTFIAKDYDTLVDSPFEVGIHQKYDFEVLGKPHQLAIWGQGNVDPEKIISDTQKIIETEAEMFGGLPYDRYLFLLHLSGGYGGLEHRESCTLQYSRFGFRARDKYNIFIQLLAHEFFHLWNVKRIRPQALETFDYEQENYTNALWFCEGVTSYYDMVFPLRARIYDSKTFLELLSKDITRYLKIPGRSVQSLSESSFDAWIKLYRRDANSDNSQMSYYLKGELVSMILDLLIRQRHDNQRSLDDVMRIMWNEYGKPEIGYTDEALKATIESVAEMDLSDFFTRFLEGVEDLPFDEYFEPFGLQLKKVMEEEGVPYLGIRVQFENGKEIVKFVETGSPGQIAGIDAEDELLAINGIRVTAEQLSDRLKDYQENDIIQITVFHRDELKTLPVQLVPPQPSRYELVRLPNPSHSQNQNYAEWVGQK